MQRYRWTILCLAALLSALSIPAVHATPPTTASETWEYTPFVIPIKFADDNTFVDGTEISTWTGTFVGSSLDVFRVVVHSSRFRYVKGLISFDGIVEGKGGTLVISFEGKKPAEQPWSGRWVILSGTGDLANLHGQGTWWGPPLSVQYLGDIHFDP